MAAVPATEIWWMVVTVAMVGVIEPRAGFFAVLIGLVAWRLT